jgi:hypothetical protein
MDRRRGEFRLTPQLIEAARSDSWGRWWAGKKELFGDAAQIVAPVLFGIWLLTFVIGWVVRGFRGIPTGSDFRRD